MGEPPTKAPLTARPNLVAPKPDAAPRPGSAGAGDGTRRARGGVRDAPPPKSKPSTKLNAAQSAAAEKLDVLLAADLRSRPPLK